MQITIEPEYSSGFTLAGRIAPCTENHPFTPKKTLLATLEQFI
jgi:hypothetical protein